MSYSVITCESLCVTGLKDVCVYMFINVSLRVFLSFVILFFRHAHETMQQKIIH